MPKGKGYGVASSASSVKKSTKMRPNVRHKRGSKKSPTIKGTIVSKRGS